MALTLALVMRTQWERGNGPNPGTSAKQDLQMMNRDCPHQEMHSVYMRTRLRSRVTFKEDHAEWQPTNCS